MRIRRRIASIWLSGAALAVGAGPAHAGFALFDQTTDTIQVAGQTVIGTASTSEARVMFTSEHGGAGSIVNEWRDFQEDKQFSGGPGGINGYNYPVNFPTVFTASATLDLDQWHHIAFVYDGSEERLYLDGGLLASRAASGNVGDGDTDPQAFAVGAIFRSTVLINSFRGFIDTLRLSDVARYSGASFSAPSGDLGSDANTLLLYNFNEAPGSTTVTDLSGNGHTGTLGAGFGGATSPTFIIPEPASAALALLALVGPLMLCRRRA